MSTGDSTGNPSLDEVIRQFLEAEQSGITPDRDAILAEHREISDRLRSFFANHERVKAGDGADTPVFTASEETRALSSSQLSSEEATIAPSPEVESVQPVSPSDEAASSPNSRTAGPPPIGAKVTYFGDYELLEEIARGGMGVVYKARQVKLNRTVALKMILTGQLASEDDVKRLYMPPEQASGKTDEVTELSDVYSLGAVVYALLTGRPPFQAANSLDSLMQVLKQQPVSPRVLAEELRRFLNGEPISIHEFQGFRGSGARIRWGPRGYQLAWPQGPEEIRVLGRFQASKRVFIAVWRRSRLTRLESRGRPVLAAGLSNGTIQVWDVTTGEKPVSARIHTSGVRDLEWHPHDSRVATAGWDGTVKVVDTDTGDVLLTIRDHEAQVYSITWSPDGRRMISGGFDGVAHVWDATAGYDLYDVRSHRFQGDGTGG